MADWITSRWLGAKFQAPVHKSGRTLSWSYEKHDIAGKTMISASLEMNANGTGTLHEKTDLANGLFKGSGYAATGIFVRQ